MSTASPISTAHTSMSTPIRARANIPNGTTFVFNYGRNEVRNFLMSNALFWFEKYHIDGLRVDAVASMLYLDYGRREGEWIPNRYGGRENLEAVEFLKLLNERVYAEFPGVMMIAEESTAWPMVSRPVSRRRAGLRLQVEHGLDARHAGLHVEGSASTAPITTIALRSACCTHSTENFVLPFSHDEVVHGKGSMIGKMPGDDWQKFANLRAALRIHVYASRQETAVHGKRIRPVVGMEP